MTHERSGPALLAASGSSSSAMTGARPLGVVLALALTARSPPPACAAWWVMPLAVVVLLALSIRRALRLK